MAGRDDNGPSGKVFFEFTRLGAQMRVAAIDEASGVEVVLIAPANATQTQMQTLALAKLKRRLETGTATAPATPLRGKLA